MNTHMLKSKRTLIDFTQKKMADKLKITAKTYNLKELGKVDFKLNEIVLLSVILKLSVTEINDIFFDNNLPIGN